MSRYWNLGLGFCSYGTRQRWSRDLKLSVRCLRSCICKAFPCCSARSGSWGSWWICREGWPPGFSNEMLLYTFRLSEAVFQTRTPKAEKNQEWNATSSHSHGEFLWVATGPMPCIVLDLPEVPGGLSSFGVFGFGRLGDTWIFLEVFDHWNYPHDHKIDWYTFCHFPISLSFLLTQQTSGFSS